MRVKKKINLVLMSCIATAVLLAGCVGNSTNKPQNTSPPSPSQGEGQKEEVKLYENGLPQDEKVVLKMGLWESGSGREWVDTAVKAFSEKYPNVTFDITASPTLSTILETKISAGDDKDMFDLFTPSFSSGDQYVRLANAGKFEPQDDLWDRDVPEEAGKKLRSVISDDAYDATLAFGYTTKMPLGMYTAGFFFNQNLFDKYGWNKSPGTWDEFVQLLEQIKGDGIIPITFPGVYAGYLTDYTFNMVQFDLAKANGNYDQYIDNFRNFNGAQYTTAEMKEAWNRIYELGKKGYFPEGVAALNHTQSQMQVLQGKAALVSTGDWVGNEMKEHTPADFKWGFMAIPAMNDAQQTIFVNSGVADVGFSIWKEKPELTKKWAKEFLVSLYAFDIQEKLASESGTYPIRLDFGQDAARIAKLQPVQTAVMEYAERHNVQYISTRRNFYPTSPEAGQAGKLVSEMITAVATGKKDPLPVLEEAEALLQKALEKEDKQQ
ncbi:ABC transporter substrate-binding protein [Paenibacillus sp. PAMC21692]|uniref:ABC transporter substrate-binding protein n=1 Tax=Paenibacillus sp. PAMC21692 TaxID=2762320 RepID=UPI00164EA546|nr:ABC transporter substrate-binding protein [Paenibacillus sp. PAMC21692]QNK57297.1 extracellular solute-binding protein [Paenibacillus sp. PAMC21692]